MLHREEVALADLADVEDASDVGVRHAQRHPDVGQDLLEPIGIALDVGRRKIQRDRLLPRVFSSYSSGAGRITEVP